MNIYKYSKDSFECYVKIKKQWVKVTWEGTLAGYYKEV